MSPENGKQALLSGDRILSAVDITVFRFLAQTLGNFLEHYPSTGLVLSDRLKYQLEYLPVFALKQAVSLLPVLFRLRKDLDYLRILWPREEPGLKLLYGFINDAWRRCQTHWGWQRFLGLASHETIRFLFLCWGQPSLFGLLDCLKKTGTQFF